MANSTTIAPLACSIDSGDTAFVLIGAVMILFMMTSLALFEGGLLRSNNTLSILMAIMTSIVVNSVIFLIIGYSLTFGTDHGGFIGGFDYAFFINVSNFDCNPVYATGIPHSAYAFFEMMFYVICPLLVTGAYAERVGARTSLVFGIIWNIVVYIPVAHWVWSDGGWLKERGVLDFAGGIVLHTTAGAASLVSALFMGRRVGFELVHGEFPPSNLPLATIGATGLWVGWFFFNGASALKSNGVAMGAALSTQIGGSVCAFMYYLFSSVWTKNKPSFVAVLNGIVAGFAGITPASGYISSAGTVGLGVVLSISFWTAILMKRKFLVDDALDVTSVHGVTGIIGSLAVGLIATKSELSPSDGVFYGGEWSFFGWQCVAVLVAAAWSAFWTLAIWFVMNKVQPVRFDVVKETNGVGLDIHDHGEFAYHGLVLKGKETLFETLLDELEAAGSPAAGDDDQRSPLLEPAPQQDGGDSASTMPDGSTSSSNSHKQHSRSKLHVSLENAADEAFGSVAEMSRSDKKRLLLRLAQTPARRRASPPTTFAAAAHEEKEEKKPSH
jgi:Amt family ammonium transporter